MRYWFFNGSERKKGKDKLKDSQLTEIVYKLNCKDCDKVYIGQTK